MAAELADTRATGGACFDSAYLMKLFSAERGSAEVRTFAGNQSTLACCIHGRAEVIAALHRKFREGTFDAEVLAATLDQFATECEEGLISFFPIQQATIRTMESVYRNAPATLYLRAADALHLASASKNGFEEIFSNDRGLLAAAPLFGLRGVDLISDLR